MNENINQLKPASIGIRFVALIIDIVIIVPLGIFFSFLIAVSDLTEICSIGVIIPYLPSLITIFYFIFMTGYLGKTEGKIILKIKVVNNDGAKVSYLKAFLRYSIYILPLLLIPFFFGLNVITKSDEYLPAIIATLIVLVIIVISSLLAIAFTKDKRALHDFIAGTKVIKSNS